jgi:hypothetical protein
MLLGKTQQPDLHGNPRNGGCCPPTVEDTTAEALEVNDNTTQTHERQPLQQGGDKPA